MSHMIINDAINHYYTIQSINLALIFSNSNFESISCVSDELMTYALGSKK